MTVLLLVLLLQGIPTNTPYPSGVPVLERIITPPMDSTVPTVPMPHPMQTPGVTRPLRADELCKIRWGTDRRFVTVAMKKTVFEAYGIPWEKRALYEVDHRVPRSLGGADVLANLWVQLWKGQYGAKAKDNLERRLTVLVCTNVLSLEDAQSIFKSDWTRDHILRARPRNER